VSRRGPADHPPPWPLADEIAAPARAASIERTLIDAWESCARLGGDQNERLLVLTEAREGLVTILALLDRHSHSPAAANLDLAIHQIEAELAHLREPG
jgi:hypothetical protein